MLSTNLSLLKRMCSSIKIPIQSIKKLRQQTNAPIGQCKKALQQSNNNFNEALKWLQKKGMSSAEKMAGKQTRQGVIACQLSTNRDKAVLMQVNCQTDFVAKSQLFLNFVNKISRKIVESQHIFKIQQQNAQNEEQLNRFMENNAPCDVFEQKTNKNLKQQYKLVIARLQENIRIRRVITLHCDKGNKFGHYIHQTYQPGIGSQVCVTQFSIDPEFQAQQDEAKQIFEQFSDNISAQILGCPPKYLTPNQIPQQQLQEQADKVRQQMAAALSKAPEQNHERMISGKLNANYYSQVLLTSMNYILSNDGESVGQYWSNIEQQTGKTIDIVRTLKWER